MENAMVVITKNRGTISCNFEQVEKAIRDTLSEYKGAIFTEESKGEAKKEVAKLRKEKKSLQENLREEKKLYMQPWEEFESQAKELIAMFDEPIDYINGKIQELEESRITKKKELIAEIYEELLHGEPSLGAYIPLDRIYNQKWENATKKESEIRKEIFHIVDRTEKDICIIYGMDSEAVPRALEIYRKNLDFTEAISYINSYERQRQEILSREQEHRHAVEETRIRREERERMMEEQRVKEKGEAALRKAEIEREEAARRAEEEKMVAIERAKEEAKQEVINSLIPDSDDDTELYEYRFSLSKDAKEKLEMYLDSVGIEWEMI